MGFSSRNPHLLWQGEIPLSSRISQDTTRVFSLQSSCIHQGLAPAHTTHTQSPCQISAAHVHTDRHRPWHSAWPNTPRTAHFALEQPNFLTHCAPAWNCTHTQVPLGTISQGHPQGLFLPLLHELIHSLCSMAWCTSLNSPMLYLTLESVQFPQAHMYDEVVSFSMLLFIVAPHDLRSPSLASQVSPHSGQDQVPTSSST